MCGGTVPGKEDAAQALSDLIYHSGYMAEGLRKLIRKEWPRVCQLAHQIHDEELSEQKKLDRAIREVECLSTATLKNVLEGKENQETIELVKYYARKVLEIK